MKIITQVLDLRVLIASHLEKTLVNGKPPSSVQFYIDAQMGKIVALYYVEDTEESAVEQNESA